MANELTMVTTENISVITQNAPQAYQNNKTSHDRCIEFGQSLLNRVRAEGMTDELDQEIATFIDRARKTVKKMNDGRAPITKLFDEFRKVFTTMENDVDVTKSGSIPALLQEERNKYARKKAAEEAARRAEEERKHLAEQARKKYRADLMDDYQRQFNTYVGQILNGLTQLNSSLSLDNWDAVTAEMKGVSDVLAPAWIESVYSSVLRPVNLTLEQQSEIRNSVAAELRPRFEEQFKWEVGEHKSQLLARLPSKKQELESAAKASAEEAARIQAEMQAREAAEAARQEQERREREEQERRMRETAGQIAEVGGLFDNAAVSVPSYQPKTSVKKKITPLNVEAFPVMFAFWWEEVGRKMTVEELSKQFKTIQTFCDKRANDKSSPVFLQDENIYYEDDIKAK
ncbi:MAG: hypothetical protein IKY66_03345 [Bacteroidales bacterium]|nr:hypothetical protein [Bacteroidales bacterium]